MASSKNSISHQKNLKKMLLPLAPNICFFATEMFTTITKAKQNYDQIDSPYKKFDNFTNFEAMMPIRIILLPLSTFELIYSDPQ